MIPKPQWMLSLLLAAFGHLAFPVLAQQLSVTSKQSTASSQHASRMTHHYFKTSDDVRLHYLEAGDTGDNAKQTLVLIPGWIMPAAVFEAQLLDLSTHYRVLALDPRSHGKSDVAKSGHDPLRRTRDIDEFLKAAKVQDFILAGWSLGVLEALDYVARFHPQNLKGLILIDNSIGEGKPPTGGRSSNFPQTMNDPKKREAYMRQFSKDIFRKPAPPNIADAVVESALRAPPKVAIELLNQPYPRTYWRETLENQEVPVMYVVTPRLKDQAAALEAKRPPEMATVLIFEKAGHALFVDEAERFNTAVLDFSQRTFAGSKSP